jgi:hypothetical protein
MNNAIKELLQAIGYFIIGSFFGLLLAVVYTYRMGGF